MIYREIIGDLFTAPANSILVHCISADFALGAGIAKEFAKRGTREELLKKYSQNHWEGHGYALSTKIEGFKGIYNLVTKEKYWHKPTYKTLEEALREVRKRISNYRCTLAMPCIGSGLDKLEWEKIRDIITKIFEDSNAEIIVYRLK